MLPAISRAGAAGHLDDAPVVLASFDDDVDLDRRESRLGRGVDRLEHACNGEVDVVHAPENRVIERIEADGNAFDAGIAEREGLLTGQQRAVRRQCNILHTADTREHGHETLEVAAKERFAAGEADLGNSFAHEELRQARDLFKAQ